MRGCVPIPVQVVRLRAVVDIADVLGLGIGGRDGEEDHVSVGNVGGGLRVAFDLANVRDGYAG